MRIMLFGTFDHLHPGHLSVLREAGLRGEDVTVVVARDKNVERMKGKPPEQGEDERMAAIRLVFPSFDVRIGDDADFLAPVRSVRPDLILLGYDQMLPPGVTEADLGATVERLHAFEPKRYKSSLRRTLLK